MKSEYRKLMDGIHAPQGLQSRVLRAAREMQSVERRARRQPWQAAICGVFVLALLVLGVIRLQTEKTKEYEYAANGAGSEEDWSVSACAAEWGANGGVYLPMAENLHLKEFAGTVRTLAITFSDGSEVRGTYSLQEEQLRAFVNEDGERILAPVLAGDEGEVAGLYAVPSESVWFQWPVEGAHTVSLNAPYGLRVDGAYFHSGIDIPAESGTAVTAAAGGIVTESGFDADKGNYLILDHGSGIETIYAHCLELAVKEGDVVAAGQTVAAVGATGMATGPHLHFEVRQDGEAQNPVAFFAADIRSVLKMG